MDDVVIRCEGLGKRYRIRHEDSPRYVALRDVIAEKARSLLTWKRAPSSPAIENFWALTDVSFDVRRGEVVGILGRNGAGKSTLLKILSRITEPTTGRATIHGRVASLLEVGTGFHPELTGRENIFLNGAVLGMSRAEIAARFDQIVAFADMERFLDTPVKRYSSGMYVRLAFAVAAHLEPEILIVDEVLAVGDAEFQKKCLGKLKSVASGSGRTVLFVSHNLGAVAALCDRSILLSAGSIAADADTRQVIARYLGETQSLANEVTWAESDAPGTPDFRLLALKVRSARGAPAAPLSTGDDVIVEMEFLARTTNPALCVGFDLASGDGAVAFRSYQTDLPPEKWPAIRSGHNLWRCRIPAGLLNGGEYSISPRVGLHNVQWIVHGDPVLRFEVLLDHGESPLWHSLTPGSRPGAVAPVLAWEAAA
jgi:lipopolysaccharide transport system ATP-binding protein